MLYSARFFKFGVVTVEFYGNFRKSGYYFAFFLYVGGGGKLGFQKFPLFDVDCLLRLYRRIVLGNVLA